MLKPIIPSDLISLKSCNKSKKACRVPNISSKQGQQRNVSLISSLENTVVTQAQAARKQHKDAQQEGDYIELCPAAFHAYRESSGRVHLPVNFVNVDTAEKSPVTSTIGNSYLGSCTLLSLAKKSLSALPEENTNTNSKSLPTQPVCDNNSVHGASSTKSALLELFKAPVADKNAKTASSKKKS